MAKKRKGKSVRKNRERSGADEDSEIVHAPHSFVIHRGSTGKYVQELCRDFRKVMEPFTASNIKVRPKNVIKDFVHVAGALNVSHMCMFTKTSVGPYFKVARFPRGPTLTFRVNEYALARDVRSSLKRQITYEKQYQNHPLLIMNGFTGQERQIQLMSSMFQNMFPSINVTKVKLNSIRRCVLLNYDATDGSIEFRHYTIKVVPVGASRQVKKLVVQSKIPNLGRYDDISDVLVAGGGNASESSEGEDEDAKVQLPQSISSRGNLNAQSSAVRLVELGPRIRLELIKIEEGLQDGEVLYHRLQSKTEAEKKAIRAAREKRKKEKEKRKKEQEMNVKRKQKEKEQHKNKSLEGMRKKEGGGDQIEEVPEGFEGEFAAKSEEESDEDDDAKWYEREVGEAPDKDLFDGIHRKRKFTGSGERSGDPRFKKMRKSGGDQPNRGGGGQNDKSRPKFTVKMNQKSNFGAGGGGGQNQYHGKTSKFGAGGASKSKFGNSPKSKFGNSSKSKFGGNNKSGGGGNDRRDGGKKKRPTQVFNSQGVGPNFKRKGHK